MWSSPDSGSWKPSDIGASSPAWQYGSAGWHSSASSLLLVPAPAVVPPCAAAAVLVCWLLPSLCWPSWLMFVLTVACVTRVPRSSADIQRRLESVATLESWSALRQQQQRWRSQCFGRVVRKYQGANLPHPPPAPHKCLMLCSCCPSPELHAPSWTDSSIAPRVIERFNARMTSGLKQCRM